MNIAILGASNKPDRYSYKALMKLREKGFTVFPIHQRLTEIEGIKVYASIDEIDEPIDTLTLYVNADISSKAMEGILKKKPRRIIFNPGAENSDLEMTAKNEGIETLSACTLVMLNTNQF